MFFDNLRQIPKIAARGGTSIFVVPNEARIEVPQAILLQPEEKSVITIEQVRAATAGLGLKQTGERFVVIRPAEKLGLEAANALLKNLEEPSDRVHYILVTSALAEILPTIRSRAAVYVWRDPLGFSLDVIADDEQRLMAKKLIAAKPTDVIEVAEKIAKKKAARAEALEVLGVAIEMLYKSYFITGKEAFVQKLPQFLQAHENIAQNGNVKLQIVANATA